MVSIYLALHIASGKTYFGKTQDVEKRWNQHCWEASRGDGYYLHRALRLYGADAFVVQKIDEASDQEKASELERWYIKNFRSDESKNGYNLTSGGEGVSANEETRRKISETHKKLGTKPPGNKGVKYSPERCQQMSEARKGIPSWNKGKSLSEEHVQNLKKSHRKDLPTDKILGLRSRGFSCEAIAEDFGASAHTISKILKEAGLVVKVGGYYRRPIV